MKVDLFDFYLPEELIAQTPSEKRDHSRLLAVMKTNISMIFSTILSQVMS